MFLPLASFSHLLAPGPGAASGTGVSFPCSQALPSASSLLPSFALSQADSSSFIGSSDSFLSC